MDIVEELGSFPEIGPVDPDALAAPDQPDLYFQIAAVPDGFRSDAGVFRTLPDQIPVPDMTEGAAERSHIQSFQKIGLSLGVFSEDYIDLSVEADFFVFVIPEIAEFYSCKVHFFS